MNKKIHNVLKNQAYIGCSGFSERLWKGFFYPEELPAKEYLEYYSRQLKCVEINSTFYRKPTLKTLENWYIKTPDDFRFFIKIPKAISHIQRLKDTEADTEEFCAHIAAGLKEKLAGFLFQLPPSFHYTEENLQRVLSTVGRQYQNVVEFRHRDWWNAEVLAKLKQENIIFSGVSFPKDIPDEVIMNNDGVLYYRLHGTPVLFKSEYSEEFLKDLAQKIEKFKGEKFIFFNNTFGTAGIKNALFLNKILQKKTYEP